MNQEAGQVSLSNKSEKNRFLLVISVFVFPIVLTFFIFSLVYLISDINFKVVGTKSEFAAITSPKNKTAIKDKFIISGSVNKPLEGHTFYLIENREGKFWPKFSLGNQANDWSKELTNRAAKNKFSSFEIIMADKQLQQELENWFESSRNTGKYPGISKLDKQHTVAKVRVKKL